MILFSTFNHFFLLLLFIYLGLSSGIVFCFVNKFTNIFSFKKNKRENPKKERKLLFFKLGTKLFRKNNKTNQSITKNSNLQQRKLKKNKLQKATLLGFVRYTIKETLKIFTLFLCVFVSFLINLQLNFGYLRPIYVVLWIIFFIIGKSLFNLLANFFTSFYNYCIKRIKKNGRAKQ